MNVAEAKTFLENEFGWRVYHRSCGDYLVYDTNGYNGVYTSRKLIKLATSRRSNHWKPNQTGKTKTGPGGKNCICCTKAPPDEMKRWERRAIRRKKFLMELDIYLTI